MTWYLNKGLRKLRDISQISVDIKLQMQSWAIPTRDTASDSNNKSNNIHCEHIIVEAKADTREKQDPCQLKVTRDTLGHFTQVEKNAPCSDIWYVSAEKVRN